MVTLAVLTIYLQNISTITKYMSTKSRDVIFSEKNNLLLHNLGKGLYNFKSVNLWRTHGDLRSIGDVRSIYGEILQLTPGEPMVCLSG